MDSDGSDLFAEGMEDLKDEPPRSSACADVGHSSRGYYDGLPFIGTSSYNDHSWDANTEESEAVPDVPMSLRDADLPLAADVCDVEDVIQSIANLKEYRERVLKNPKLYELNITI
jgi:hypothetical protein